MILAWAGLAFASMCAGPVPVSAVTGALDAAEQGFASLDVGAFGDRLDQAALALPCVSAVLSPAEAARYHALVGLRLFTLGEEQAASLAFAAARSADPGFRLASSLVPPGHEVLALFDRSVPGSTEPVPPPARGGLWFDGVEGEARPSGRPAIVQHVDGDGTVLATAWVGADDPLPAYEVAAPLPAPVAPVAPVPQPQPVPPERERKPRWVLLGGAGVAAIAAGALYGAAAASEARFRGPLPPEAGRDDLLALRDRTNALVIGSGVAGGVAAVGVVAFVVVR